jgi:natural product biosynthesis luciferase-like monooxygenase protein/amino acid adenylation domain-containing protein
MTVNTARTNAEVSGSHLDEEAVFPLTSGQREILVAQELDRDNPRFNCGGYLDVDGTLNVDVLQRAIRQVVGECAALGVEIIAEDSSRTLDERAAAQHRQRIIRPEAPLRVLDFSFEAEPLKVAEEWMRADLGRPVSLHGASANAPRFLHALLTLSPERCLFYFRYHHFLLDGFGQALYWKRLADVYSRLLRGEEPGASPFGALAEVVAEERRYQGSPQHEQSRAYWERTLEGAAAPASLLAEPSYQVARRVLRRQRATDPAQRGWVRKAALAHRTTWSAVALAAVAAYLHRVTGACDLILGLPVRARAGKLALTTPCMLANELPLRLSVRAEMSFAELVAQVASRTGELLAHQRVRGEELHRARRQAQGAAQPPPVVVNLVSFDASLSLGGRRGAVRQLSSGPVRDLLIEIFGGDSGAELEVCFEGNAERYSAAELAAHHQRFLGFLGELTGEGRQALAGAPLGQLPLLLPEERAQLRRHLDGAARGYPLDRPLHQLIDEQARRTPAAIAVELAGARPGEGGDADRGDDEVLRYGELIAGADRLAQELLARGAGGKPIGVHLERSLELMVSLLAILKAGGAYLPLDPELPASRLAFQIEDAGLPLVLTTAARRGELPAGTPVIAIDEWLAVAPAAAERAPAPALPRVAPGDAAYVLYTSGSTGQPKAVVVPHRGIVNRLCWMQEEYALTADDRVLQKTPLTFDVSVWELFWPLLTGARLVLCAPGLHRDPRHVAEVIAHRGITALHFVPPMLELFLADAPGPAPRLRLVVCSGEALRAETVRAFFARFPRDRVELHNLYGPTEASVDVTWWRCLPEHAAAAIPIGRPVANTQLYILDAGGQEVIPGAAGELFIGGVQVATGYLGRAALTAERFRDGGEGRGTLYRTGDLVRLRGDGAVEFLGRLDHQVKIRGNRVELGEIEAALAQLPEVEQVVVTAPAQAGAGGARQLIAYVVLVAGAEHAEPMALAERLRDRLPSYMIPAHVVALPRLPLTSSGKVDRKALPSPVIAAPAPAPLLAVPSSPHEVLLAAAWRKVLRLAEGRPGLDESFFALGGDSMSAIQVRAELERSGKTFTISELMQKPSIRALARALRPWKAPARSTRPFGLVPAADRGRLPAGLDDAYPLTSMQAGMLYHASYAERSSLYRVVTAMRIAAPFSIDALRAAAADLVARHPQLRCSFDLTRFSEPLQLVHRSVRVPIHVAGDLSRLPLAEQRAAVAAWMEEAKLTAFELTAPPLLRFAVHLCGEGAFVLSAIEHHVVLDGWSDMRMLEELERHYRARLAGQALWLPEIPSTYRDLVAAERKSLGDATAREFWKKLLAGADGQMLPRAAGGAPHQHRRFDVPLAEAMTARLRALAAGEGLPLKALLAAAHLLVLRAFSGRDEVVTGVIANARLEEAGGDEVIGVFLNTLPLRVELTALSLLEIAHRVFAAEQSAAPHRRYPFAQMQRDQGGELHLDSYVSFMDFHTGKRRAAGAELTIEAGIAETNYPLAADFLIDPEGHGLLLWLDCDLGALSLAHCQRLVGYYQRALAALADSPQLPAVKLELMGEEEHAQLARWNHTPAAFDLGATVHGLIDAQARRTPAAIALAHGASELTYAELVAAANRVAHRLRKAGVRKGDRVGVSLRRGNDLVASLLGVMKAGAAYVPMDPAFPQSRLELIASDADIACLLTAEGEATFQARAVVDFADTAGESEAPLVSEESGEDTAYVIYTSGSTGRPKGTAIRHRNVVNFFAGMDERVGCGPQDAVLAVTSISFDISVLELFWPLARGAKVVVAGEGIVHHLAPSPAAPEERSLAAQAMGMSLFFFAATTGSARDGYQLVLDAARFADTHDFEAIWTPERHFHAFGGLYPNPSVMSAALATITRKIGLRCGSVVAPLHDTLRLAEEWSLVDNLSGGRVGLAFAPGWNSNDFALAPERFADRKQIMNGQLADFCKLWRGEPLVRENGTGQEVALQIHPRPVQELPPLWLTSVGAVETFQRAGAAGVNVLTHLLGQRPEDLAAKIAAYRQARADAGHDGPGHVTLMVHAFVLPDAALAKQTARGPFREYLRSSAELWRTLFTITGKDFPASGRPDDLEAVIELAIERYFESSGLFGSPETCLPLVRALKQAGVDELACLVDFGIPAAQVMEGLTTLDQLRRRHRAETDERQLSLVELVARHRISMVQGTPSLMSAIAAEPEALAALASARAVLVGGEAFPAGLAQKLLRELPRSRVLNMYGPTETTIWSAVYQLDPAKDGEATTISIGQPIANTTIHILDRHGRTLPIGVAGELCIGGEGVAAGYLHRPELTAERFVAHPQHGRLYRTGDRAAWRDDGNLEFLGRMDRQVKILGHRIEPDEIESVLSRHPEIDSVAVIPRSGEHGVELVAYVSPAKAALSDPVVEASYVRGWGEVWQRAYQSGDTVRSPFAGWNSSYDGRPIPEAHMREWLGHTVDRIRTLQPRAIADIGVGVGLVLRELAQHTDQYHGVDISAAALEAAAQSLGDRLPEHVRLQQAGPEYLETLPARSLDVVVLNSVIQYFPSTAYLRRVLASAVRAVRPGGSIFIGDVRAVEMLAEFHAAVQLHRAQALSTVEEVRSAVGQKLQEERELCLSPSFFRGLPDELPQISEVRVELKRGRADNELTQFRYDVSLMIEEQGAAARPNASDAPLTLPFSQLGESLENLRQMTAKSHQPIVVTGIPNRRLARIREASRLLDSLPDDTTVWDLERMLWDADDRAGWHPEDIISIARSMGRRAQLNVREDGRLESFDAVLLPP